MNKKELLNMYSEFNAGEHKSEIDNATYMYIPLRSETAQKMKCCENENVKRLEHLTYCSKNDPVTSITVIVD